MRIIGFNEERRSGRRGIAGEDLTSHIWSSRIFYDVTPDLSVQVLGRFGLRRYNEAFSERNASFWTVGAHVGWRVSHRIMLGLTYHYERGLATGRHEPQFQDDTSYVNHYLTADVDIELTERLSLLTAMHYELNNWTSGMAGDERNGAHEDIYQGEVRLRYQLTESLQELAGFQHSTRKQSFEASSIKENNVGIGLAMLF